MRYSGTKVWVHTSGLESRSKPTANLEDWVRFDSLFEHEVYKRLTVYGHSPCIHTTLKFPVLGTEKTFNFDFFLPNRNLLIEAKGYCTREFKWKLRTWLQSGYQQSKNLSLIIVSNNSQVLKIVRAKEFKEHLVVGCKLNDLPKTINLYSTERE